MNILLIEDDRSISNALKYALASNYTLYAVATGAEGLERAKNTDFKIILLDLNLPDMNGLDICQQLRSSGIVAPILILTGEGAILSKIALLDAGANDYLTKPFSLGELKARLRVLERQITSVQPSNQFLCVNDVVLDCHSHQVRRAGTAVVLRRKEFSILECLMKNAGMVVSRQAITDYAWHDDQDPWTNTIDVHIKYLRDKIDRPFNQPLIKTIHGLGYKLDIKSTNKRSTESKAPAL